jgi:uncharacterized OB-fold protein
MSDTTEQAVKKEHLVMDHFVSLTYTDELSPNLVRFGDRLLAGTISGQKCPSCGKVFIPGKGYCPICVVAISESDEVELSDQGTLTGYTIVTPVHYYGQKETEPFVHASVLLDGSDSTIAGQRITGVPHDKLRAGLRLKAVWKPESDRNVDDLSNRGWGSVDGAIDSFEPNGEPDAPREHFQEHIF